jgi:hypothetical protein
MTSCGDSSAPACRHPQWVAILIVALASSRAPALEAEPAPARSHDPAPAGDPAAWVDERVERWRPRPEERRLDEIGWARDIRDALRVSGESRRPVFLFTHDGRMGIGRC